MKTSIYNFSIEEEGYGILFNVVTDKILQLDKATMKLIEKNEEHIEDLANIHPDLWNALIDVPLLNSFLLQNHQVHLTQR